MSLKSLWWMGHNLLTSHSDARRTNTVRSYKPTVAQIVKKSFSFKQHLFIFSTKNSPPTVPILTQFQPKISHHISYRQDSLLSPLGSTYRRLSDLFLSDFPHKILYIFIMCLILPTCPTHHIGLHCHYT